MFADPFTSTDAPFPAQSSALDAKGDLHDKARPFWKSSRDRVRSRRPLRSLASMAKPVQLSEEDDLRAEVLIDDLLITKLQGNKAQKIARLRQLCELRECSENGLPQTDAVVPDASAKRRRTGEGVDFYDRNSLPRDTAIVPASIQVPFASPDGSIATLFPQPSCSSFLPQSPPPAFMNVAQAVPTLNARAYAEIAKRLDELDAEQDSPQRRGATLQPSDVDVFEF